MINKSVRRYSLALYLTAEKVELIDTVANDFKSLLTLTKKVKKLNSFFISPVINLIKKPKIVDSLFKGKINPLTINFIKLLIARNREMYINEIMEDYLELKDEKEGYIKASVKSTFPLDSERKNKIKNKIDETYNLKSIIDFQIDESLLGGFTIQLNDTILDASVKRQLELLKNKLIESKNFNIFEK